jgi:glutathione S-transferase
MKLYGSLLSPFVMRVLLGARFKGIDLPVEAFEGGIKSADYLTLNPMGKMPLLVDGDFALPESQVILAYLDETQPGPRLLPDDPKERARARLIAGMVDSYITPHLGTLFNARENKDAVPAALEKMAAALGYIEHFRRDGDSFAIGDAFTVADATLMPTLFFFDALAKPFGTDALIAQQPRLKSYWDAMKASDLGSRAIKEQGESLAAFMASPR